MDRQLPTGTPDGAVNRRKLRPRAGRGAIAAVLAGASVLTGCTAAGGGEAPSPDRAAATAHQAGCRTTVRGVVPSPGSITAGWLPDGFELTGGGVSTPGATPGATYAATGEGADPPRIQLHFSYRPGPLSPLDGGNPSATPVEVQGHPGLLESGPPAAQFIGVYWKPTAGELVSTVGYKVPSSVVVQVAQGLRATPPGAVSLPETAGRIVTRSTAMTAARQAVHIPAATVRAKLSSWTEVTALLQADSHTADGRTALSAVASTLGNTPWAPIWAVLVSTTTRVARVGSPAMPVAIDELVAVDAASGRTELVTPVGSATSWFAAVSDRDPELGGCPGGSTARLPFGVLTRSEEAYSVRDPAVPGAAGGATSVVLELTTVPLLNRANPGLYGGCVQQSCSLNELVWPTIVVVRAPRGKTLACLPPEASVPPGYHPRQVKEYTMIDVAGSGEIVCGPLPGWVGRLRDLAPPATR